MSIPPRLWFYFWSSATVVYWCGLAALLHLPPSSAPKQPDWFPHLDKVVHGVLYAGLTFLICATTAAFRSLRYRGASPTSRFPAWRIVGFVAAYALIDELTQPLTRRTTDPLDFAADVAGAVIVVAVWSWLQPAARAST